MSRRFNNKDNPISARRKLQFIKQYEFESLQEFPQRVHFITIDGYSESGRKAVDQISTESFIRGCRVKETARSVMEKNPKNVHEALGMIKTSIANNKLFIVPARPIITDRFLLTCQSKIQVTKA